MKIFAPAAFTVAVFSFGTAASAQVVALQEKTTIQPSLALTYAIDANAFVHIFAGNFTPEGMGAADGQILPIAGHTDLFNLIGTSFGGDGVTTFALPDLNGRVAVGAGTGPGLAPADFGNTEGTENVFLNSTQFPTGVGGLDQPFNNLQPSLNLHYIIAEQGVFPSRDSTGDSVPFLGEVSLFAGTIAPHGWAFADGTLLSIASNTALFSLLGTTFGGNGTTTFALPDLRGRTPIGAGTGPGLTPRGLGEMVGTDSTTLTNANIPSILGGAGQSYDNMQPSLGLNFFLAPAGIFPAHKEDDAIAPFTDPNPVLAELFMFGGNFVPGGFFAADGSVLPISSHTALFSLLENRFGGNGISTFALPDLRGRDVIGAGSGPGLSTYIVGETAGVESLHLDANAPPVDPPPVTGVPEPATFVYVSLFGVALIARKSFAKKKCAG